MSLDASLTMCVDGPLLLVTDLTAGPNRVMNVDYESMRVLDGDMPVRMVMWFGSFPSFVLMVMMLSVKM